MSVFQFFRCPTNLLSDGNATKLFPKALCFVWMVQVKSSSRARVCPRHRSGGFMVKLQQNLQMLKLGRTTLEQYFGKHGESLGQLPSLEPSVSFLSTLQLIQGDLLLKAKGFKQCCVPRFLCPSRLSSLHP